MNAQEQKEFVADILNCIKNDIYAKIDTDAIPESWDGRHLRLLICDKFKHEEITTYMTQKEKRDYQNYAFVYNL